MKYILIVVCMLFMYNSCIASEGLKASWYSIESLKEEGTWKNGIERRMANGERFVDTNDTCANNLFPLGTVLRITNLENGKSVVVKTTDRIGKRFSKTRVDLSKGAFNKIANLESGLIKIRVERIK